MAVEEPLTLEEMVSQDTTAAGKTDPAAQTNTATDTTAADTTTSDSTTAADAGTAAAVAEGEPPEAAAAATEEPAASNEADVTIMDWGKDVIGDKPWLQKYKNNEEFLRGMDELQTKLGERDEAANTLRWMQDRGITAADIQRLAAEKTGAPSARTAEPAKNPEWDASWVYVDPKTGNWLPTAKAPADFEAKASARKLLMSQAMAGDPDAVKIVFPHLKAEMQEVATSTKAEVQSQLAQQREQAATDAWHEQHADLLYTKDRSAYTPLATKANELLTSHPVYSNPQVAWTVRADAALQAAASAIAPKPTKRLAPLPAKRVAATASAVAKPVTDEEAHKQSGGSLLAFARAVGDPHALGRK